MMCTVERVLTNELLIPREPRKDADYGPFAHSQDAKAFCLTTQWCSAEIKCRPGLSHVRQETERWLKDFNTVRPHKSLGDIAPLGFLNDRGRAELSSYGWT